MRFNIKYKLFLTLLLTTFVVVGSMVILARWSFERGFLEYINQLEQETHEKLVTQLQDNYGGKGSWEFIRQDPGLFRDMHRQSMPLPGRAPAEKGMRHAPPHHLSKRIVRRLCLLDAERQAVISCRHDPGDLQLTNIRVDGVNVGYLGVAPRKKLSGRHDLQFSERHHRFLLYLAIAIILVSAVVAFPVSRQLVKPVKLLTDAMAKLAAGNYQTRVNVDSSDELGELSRDFNSLARTLESNETARQQWIADISHELRTPLSVLRGEIEAMQDGIRKLNTERLDSLHTQIMNLHRLVDDLYELSMSDIGALNYQMSSIDINTVLNQCVDTFRDEYQEKNIEIQLRGNEQAQILNADSERLFQLISNLLSNSLRYTDANGETRIGVSATGKELVLCFEDSAPAVPEEDLPRLFDRLFRVENSRSRETGGTGLGLAICRNIVEAHGGQITASLSELGGLKIQISFGR